MITIKKIKRKLIEMPRNFFLFKIGAAIRYFKKRPLPKNPEKPVLIHIGCGEFNDKRYINVDTRPGWHIHYVDSIENCEKLFPANYADLIYTCQVLEHVSHLKLLKTIRGLFRCLKGGGILRLSVPDFDTIIKMY
jgi:predicted SAM-dependent methyltransferase